MDDGYVLVIGSAGINISARPDLKLKWNAPNPGHIHTTVGGVARNIAENLARLEIETVLLTAVGDDMQGDHVIQISSEAGIDCSRVLRVADYPTGAYLSLLKPDDELHAAISDFDIMEAVDSDYLLDNESLFAGAEMIVIDATLQPESLATIFELATRYQVRVCADPTTPALAHRLCDYIPHLFLVVPNSSETRPLCQLKTARDRDTATDIARHLVSLGAQIAVVTMGEKGVAYADGSGGGFIRAVKTDVVDTTGAGDAFSGAVIFGLLNGVSVDEAMRLGITAASLTIQSTEIVLPELSQDLLYDELRV